MWIFEIYKNGVDAWTMLQQIRKVVRISSANDGEPDTVGLRVDRLRSQVCDLSQIWARCPQPQPAHEKEAYDQEVKAYKNAIEHLESLARNAMIDRCLDGSIVAIGYRNYGDFSPLPIQPTEWPFLRLNFKESASCFNNIEYRAIRFLWEKQLSTKHLELLKNMPPPIFEDSQKRQREIVKTLINETSTHASHIHIHVSEQTKMGDTYNINGQVGAVGSSAKAEANNFQQISLQAKDFTALTEELATLRTELRKKATEPEHDEALGAIAAAEKAARKGDESTLKEHLKSAGKWAMDAATKLGTNIAAKAIEQAMGL